MAEDRGVSEGRPAAHVPLSPLLGTSRDCDGLRDVWLAVPRSGRQERVKGLAVFAIAGRFVQVTGAVAVLVSLAPACIPKDGPVSGTAAPSAPSAPAPPGGNLLKASTFEDGRSLPWTTSFTTPGEGDAKVEQGAYCLNVRNKGKDVWDAQVRHREMTIQKGHQYQIRFTARASAPTKVRPKIGMAGPPYREYWADTVELTAAPRVFSGTFQMSDADDPTAELAFHVGGNLAGPEGPFSLCLDDVYLTDAAFTPAPPEAEAKSPEIRVNRLAYIPKRRKLATAEDPSITPHDCSSILVRG